MPDIDGHLARVEVELRGAVTTDDSFLSEVAGHLVSAGGHRWRPTLAVAAAIAGEAEVTNEVIRGACAVELVHLGSLYHDDVMDEADTRRGVASVNARWGNLVAILAGDFLLARASEIAAALGADVAELLAQTITKLCEGQVSELQHVFQPSRSEEAYFAAIAGKTAALFATSCRIGAMCAGLSHSQIEALADYGEALGMVYQIVDDIKDLILTEDELGKPAGHDLLEGVYTLPVIRALALPDVGDQLRALLDGPVTPSVAEKAKTIVVDSGAIESSLSTARSWAARSARCLDAVDGSAAHALCGLPVAIAEFSQPGLRPLEV